MPSIRSGILMVLSHKTAVEMLSREGKERLQKEIQAESAAAAGHRDGTGIEPAEDEEAPKKKKKKKKPESYPVSNVLFVQFVVQ
jgi:flagellar FliL protein